MLEPVVSELPGCRSMELYSVPSLKIENCVTVTLTEKNYILWKSQFESFLDGQGLLGFVNGTITAPDSTIDVPGINGSSSQAAKPEYSTWFKTDRVVKSWLLGSFSEDILSLVVNCKTSYEVWASVANHFNRATSSRLFELQRRLQNVSKKDKPMLEYLKDLKHICDQLASVGSVVTEKMKIFAALNGLGREYEPIKTTIENSMDVHPGPTFADVIPKLTGYDDRLQSYNEENVVSPHVAFNVTDGNNNNSGYYRNNSNRGRGRYGYRGRGSSFSTRGRGFHQQISSSTSSQGNVSVMCQICGKMGHPALKCWHRFNNSYQYEEIPAALAALRITDVTDHGGHEWYPDTGATAHVTNSPHHLQKAQSYSGTDSVMVGDGNFLPITHTGSTSLQTISGTLPLKDVLVCPKIAKSLLSVSKLTKDYPCSFEFDSDTVRVNDKATKRLLTLGNSDDGGLYVLKDLPLQAFYSSRQHSVSEDIWHRRIGHPNSQVLQQLSASKLISVNKGVKMMCEACQMGKSSRLPFSSSSYVATRPLERIHCDLWGPSPIIYVQGFKYYVIFIDNFTRFCWLYPLKLKSDFFTTFLVFQALVENQCQTKIGSFQCDGGGEFMSTQFLTHLKQCGIQQLVSCPHTPQQNGLAERKHRHIIELGLSMMFQSRIPQKYWLEAFYTANYLINLLPTTALSKACSPYEALMGHAPEYSALRVFGCACYPTLRDYAANKFDPRSLKCTFLGYNERYKGYRCLLPATGRVYISRHVLFDESEFPFASTQQKASTATLTPLVQAWLKSCQISATQAPTPQQETDKEEIKEKKAVLFTPDDFPPLPVRNNAIVSSVSEEQSPGCTTGFDPASIGNSSVSSPTRSSTPASSSATVTESSQEEEITTSAEINTNGQSEESREETQSEEIVQETVSETRPTHQMITRSKAGIHKPNPRYALLSLKTPYPEPKTVTEALKNEGWNGAMHEEVDNCKEANTWSLVPYTPNMHVLGCKWVFRTKLNADGSLDKLRARLVAQGFDQEEGIDYLETYSPVVRTATIRSVFHVATIMNWEIKQMDVKNAFLHGDLTETVYMKQPPGFVDPARPDYVCLLHKSLYGLKQAPRAWFDKFSSFLLEFGFFCCESDPSLFVYIKNKDIIMLLLYVDDMAITGNSSSAMTSLLTELNKQFRMKDMGRLHYFLGIQAHYHQGGLFLSQQKYAEDLLAVAGMTDCAPMSTPLPLQLDRVPDQEESFSNPTYFRSLVGKLQYLTLTRPDIQFAVNYVCQKMHAPSVSDFHLVKRILRYIKGTVTMGISFNKDTDCTVRAYSDSDHAGCKLTRRSTGGFCTFLGTNIISWASQKQDSVAKSSTEAEYRALSEAASEITWLCKVLKELGIPLLQAPELYGDNLSSIYLTANPAFHKRSKHFQTHYHYVRERVALGTLTVKHIPSHLQLADIFTKSLPVSSFCKFRFKLGVDVPPTPSLRGTDRVKKTVQNATVWQPKAKACLQSNLGPVNTEPIKPTQPSLTQRSSVPATTQQDKQEVKEAAMKMPFKEKRETSCQIQKIMLTNRFAVLDNDVENPNDFMYK